MEKGEEACELKRGCEGTGGGGAVTERQSNLWRLGCRDGDEEREEEWEDPACALPGSVRSGARSRRRCEPPPATGGAEVVSTGGAPVGSSSAVTASFIRSCSSSVLSAAAWAGGGPGGGAGVAAWLPLTVWRACRLVRCRGREKGTLP